MSTVICPKCDSVFSFVSDHAASIELHQECLICRFLTPHSPHYATDISFEDFIVTEPMQLIARRRLELEKQYNLRALPCPYCMTKSKLDNCDKCHNTRYIHGTPSFG